MTTIAPALPTDIEPCPTALRADARRALVLHIRTVRHELEGCVRQALEIEERDAALLLAREADLVRVVANLLENMGGPK